MLIAQILAGKGSDVVTTRPEATVAEVVRLLVEKRIGAVVVVDAAGQPCGMLSERDLARGLAEYGNRLLEMQVARLMTSEVVTCSPGDGIETLMQTMTERRCRHLPVIKDGQLSGIISIGDVVKHRLQELETEAHMLQDYIQGNV